MVCLKRRKGEMGKEGRKRGQTEKKKENQEVHKKRNSTNAKGKIERHN